MKNQIIAILMTLSTSSFAATSLDCQWLESSNQEEGFYQESNLNFVVEDESVIFTDDSFLSREYSPCFVAGITSCSFSFSHYSDVWNIQKETVNTLEITTPAAFLDAGLEMDFSDDLAEMTKGDVVTMNLSGDDGDGMAINSENFLCTVK